MRGRNTAHHPSPLMLSHKRLPTEAAAAVLADERPHLHLRSRALSSSLWVERLVQDQV